MRPEAVGKYSVCHESCDIDIYLVCNQCNESCFILWENGEGHGEPSICRLCFFRKLLFTMAALHYLCAQIIVRMNRLKTCFLAFVLAMSGLNVLAQSDATFRHTIELGQTVYAIATMYGVSTEAIYKLNPDSKNGIKAGDVLLIPKQTKTFASGEGEETYTFHTIEPKETLYAVSMKYKMPAQYIIEANPGLSVKTFASGRTIRIPLSKNVGTLSATNKTAVEKTTEKASTSIEYVVKKKETLYSLSRKFNVSSYDLIQLNPALKKGVKAGMIIKIPQTQEEASGSHDNSAESMIQNETAVNALLNTPKDIKRLNQMKVALLLPFNPEKKTAASYRFIEYYEGLLLAVDSLRNQGLSLDLSIYNIGNGTDKIREVLTGETLPKADLIIGAVQNDQIKMVADFAKKHHIKYVIPFTSKNDDVLSNECVFQVNTPHSYLYSKAAERGCRLFGADNIIFVNLPDKDEKKDFIKTFKQQLKDKHIAYKEITYKDENFASEIDSFFMESDRRNVIVPTSSSLEALQKIKTPLRTIVEARTDRHISLFGYPEWQTYVRDALDDFYALDTYIYSNFYADNLSQPVRDFYNKFKTWYSRDLINTYPKYGMLGFDTGMFFLGAMKRYGVNFEDNLDKFRYASIQTGFDFNRVNNWGGFINTNIFIVHYQPDFSVVRN